MKVQKFEIKLVDNEALHVFIDDVRVAAFHPFDKKLIEIAANDGLEVLDFHSWFSIHPKKKEQGFIGQILCWNENIEY